MFALYVYPNNPCFSFVPSFTYIPSILLFPPSYVPEKLLPEFPIGIHLFVGSFEFHFSYSSVLFKYILYVCFIYLPAYVFPFATSF